jgi:hypothetical protein
MSRIDRSQRNGRSAGRIAIAIAAGMLALTSPAWADGDHNEVPHRLAKKDHFVRDALNRMTYAFAYETTLVETCDCLEPTCDGGFMLSCGGEIEPQNAGVLTATRRTSRQTCYVCGCAEYATLRATPICID